MHKNICLKGTKMGKEKVEAEGGFQKGNRRRKKGCKAGGGHKSQSTVTVTTHEPSVFLSSSGWLHRGGEVGGTK